LQTWDFFHKYNKLVKGYYAWKDYDSGTIASGGGPDLALDTQAVPDLEDEELGLGDVGSGGADDEVGAPTAPAGDAAADTTVLGGDANETGVVVANETVSEEGERGAGEPQSRVVLTLPPDSDLVSALNQGLLSNENVTFLPTGKEGQYVAIIENETDSLYFNITNLLSMLGPEATVDLDCKGEGCEVESTRFTRRVPGVLSSGRRILLEVDEVLEVKLGCGPQVLDANISARNQTSVFSIVLEGPGIPECASEESPEAEPGPTEPMMTPPEGGAKEGNSKSEVLRTTAGGDQEEFPEAEPGPTEPMMTPPEGGAKEGNSKSEVLRTTAGGDQEEFPEAEPGPTEPMMTPPEGGAKEGNSNSEVLRTKAGDDQDVMGPTQSSSSQEGAEGRGNENSVEILAGSVAAALVVLAVAGVLSFVVVKRRRRPGLYTSESKLAGNEAALSHFRSSSGGNSRDEAFGGKLSSNAAALSHLVDVSDPSAMMESPSNQTDSFIIANPSGGDVAVALPMEDKGKRKMSPERAAMLHKNLQKLIDEDDIDD